ncbi:MAG: sigma-70 family RNA polymerase sigma factor [Candidatus Sumerlaeia bacterium]|nr:sigma-70 family RNA polymerase sigma factor [Candidatus Sumerlaeia bacterium]
MGREAELMARVGRGDADAFEILLLEHEQWARTFAFRILGNLDEAEDVAQEVFLKLWTHASRWKPERPLRSWLATLLSNQAMNVLRKKRPDQWDDTREVPDDSPGLVERLHQSQTRDLMSRWIAELPARQRMVLMLFYQEEQSMKEIAGALELTEKAVESLLSRGRQTLKQRAEVES